MKLSTKERQESYENAKFFYICKEKIENIYWKDKKYYKVREHCHYTGECKKNSWLFIMDQVLIIILS